jgi:periplasmic protein TonB
MRRFVSLAMCLFFTSFTFAQNDTTAVGVDTDSLDVIFTVVQQEAQFPGGLEGWAKYVQANLNAELGAKYIPLKKGQKTAKQTVVVNFIVDKEGNISNVSVVNYDAVHPKLAEEAMRVIKQGPKWTPARQNDRPVISRKRQNISWVVTAD